MQLLQPTLFSNKLTPRKQMVTDVSVNITLYKLQYVFIYAEYLLTTETDINNFINQYLLLMVNVLSSSNSIGQVNSRS